MTLDFRVYFGRVCVKVCNLELLYLLLIIPRQMVLLSVFIGLLSKFYVVIVVTNKNLGVFCLVSVNLL